MDQQWQRVLDFWFGPSLTEDVFPSDKTKMWFTKSTETDTFLAEEFGDLLEQGSNQGFESANDPLTHLAQILVLDQFSRNVYRDTPRAFAQDAQALSMALTAIDRGWDRQVRFFPQVFYYLPLEHAESLALQNQCVSLFERLIAEAPTSLKAKVSGYLDYAIKHRDVIARFGRFPHRNDLLGRTSTEEEINFLTQPGSRF